MDRCSLAVSRTDADLATCCSSMVLQDGNIRRRPGQVQYINFVRANLVTASRGHQSAALVQASPFKLSCRSDSHRTKEKMQIMALNDKAPSQGDRPRSRKEDSLKDKISQFLEKKRGYVWLLGPILSTAAIVVPTTIISVVDLLYKSYWIGLLAIFGLDIVFVVSSDIFFVLADKTGHHQKIPGGPSPWIGPWEYTGYPKGLPSVMKGISYAGAGIALVALFISLVVGKFSTGLLIFGPYLALIFVQVAYERLMENDRVPVYPIVPVVYTLYRFRQLARGMELVACLGGGAFLARIIRLLMAVWTLYLASHLAQLPWLYSTWNANRIS